MEPETTRHVATMCPVCGHKLDASTRVEADGHKPKPGSISVCIECAAVLTFDEGMHLRLMTAEEVRTLPDETFREVARYQAAVIKQRETRHKRN